MTLPRKRPIGSRMGSERQNGLRRSAGRTSPSRAKQTVNSSTETNPCTAGPITASSRTLARLEVPCETAWVMASIQRHIQYVAQHLRQLVQASLQLGDNLSGLPSLQIAV